MSSKVCFNVSVQEGRLDGVQMANDIKRILFLSIDINMYRPTIQCRYIRMRSVGGMISDSEDQITWK